MKNEIKILLEKLNIDPKFFNELEKATIEKVLVYEEINKIKLILSNDTNISLELYQLLSSSLKTFFGGKDVYLYLNADKVNNDYFRDYFNEAVNIISKNNPIIEIFSNRLINKDEKYYVEVINTAEERQVNIFINDLNKIMTMFGYNLNIKTILNEEKRNDVVENIKKNLEFDPSQIVVEEKKEEVKEEKKVRKYEKKEIDDNTIKGRVIKDEAIFIKLVKSEEENVTIEGQVFGNDTFEPASKAFKIITLKVTDFTDSITCKLFTREEDEYLDIVKKTQPGSWLRLRGSVKIDQYANGELVLNIRDINKIEKTSEKRKDLYPRKRVELHAHTKMSDMDGLCDEVALVKQAMSWGHPGIAITDHDCCQAFPHVFSEVTKYNKNLNAPLKEAKKKVKEIEEEIHSLDKKKESNSLGDINYDEKMEELNKAHSDALQLVTEEEEKKKNNPNFKALYGTELDMSENFLNVVFNARDEELDNATFVVFDTETTGFNAGIGDSMIEIGAVKVKNGIVQEERFDELINPNRHIDPIITNLTGISDYKVKDADNEENVVKRFKEFIGDGILVAHNAKFDKSMIDMAYYKYNLGKLENPIVDTMMLSRVINKDLKRHSLSALTKFYKIEMDEVDDEDEEDSGTVVENDEVFNNDFSGIETIKVDGKVAYSKEEAKVYQVEFEEEAEIDVEVKFINDDISTIAGYGSRKTAIKPGKNYIEIKYVIDDVEKDITIVVNKVRSHHRADYDAEKTAEMFVKMIGQLKGMTNLKELADVGYLASQASQELNPLETHYDNIPDKTIAEKVINEQCSPMHVNILAKNKVGLKNLFKIISYANTGYIIKWARIPRRVIDENREGLLVGSGCMNGEIFNIALTRSDEDLMDAMKWYDYIEVQPPDNYIHLLRGHDISSYDDILKVIKKIIECAKKAGKIVVATGDVHTINREDLIYREIIVNQSSPAKGRHPLARYLSRKKRSTNNNELLDTLRQISINEYGDDLNAVEEKVLKIIFSLTEFKDIPITRNNIIELYQPDKNEEVFRKSKTGEEKKEAILSALRKFESRNFIKTRFSEKDGCEVYVLKYELKSFDDEEVHIPNQFFRTTDEMMEEFSFLDKDTCEEIVIDNPKKILDMADEIEVIEYPEVPFSPIIENSQMIVTDMVYEKAESIYGSPLPHHIEERISKELYGDCVLNSLKTKLEIEKPDLDKDSFDEALYKELNTVIRAGFDKVKEIVKEDIVRSFEKDVADGKEIEINDEVVEKELKKRLGGVIGGGFDVIYLIAQKLVKHSNDDGYLVGSRGSVGSSFVATMMGITEVNPLPAHYVCPKCKYSIFDDENGNPLGATYSSGFDLPDNKCPKCGTNMNKNGQDMPFATFLGFNADKVPDIDLNFSGDNQASAHEYTKELFGTDNVYRAGTIATVADKTAYGYVQGYEEEKEFDRLKTEMDSYGIKPPSKDDLKKKGLIKSHMRGCEVERISLECMGVKRTTGQHPGGIVVVPGYRDVFDFTPFQYPANDSSEPWRTTHFDYHAIDQDLLKLDILGHDDPTVLRMLQDLSKQQIAKGGNKDDFPINEKGEVDVTCVPLDDKATMGIFSSPSPLGVSEEKILCPTGTLGIPEFGTKFVIQMLVDTKPTTFAELIKISGLSHGTDVWLGNAQDLIVNKVVPFKEVIGCRDDIMVYLSYHGVAPLKAFKIMEFVRKGKPSKEPEDWIKWKQVMIDANIEPWFIDSCQKIKYMFPKAHAAAYVTSAFRIAWYKVHHPLLYYAAYFSIRCDAFDIDAMVKGYDAIRNKVMEIEEKGNSASNKEKDTYGVLQLCLEAAARGIKFKNVDINKSDGKYFVIDDEDENTLIIPFKALDGLGENVASGIVEEREKQPFMSIEDLQKRGHVSKTIIDRLQAMGVLDGMGESNQMSLF